MDSLLQSVVEHSPTGLVLFEACRDDTGKVVDFRYLLTNPANTLNTNRSAEEITGKTLMELFPNIARDEFYDRMVAVIETGESQHYQHFYEGDGIKAWIDASLVRIDDRVLGIFQNVTALMRQNLELELAR
ncbi:MAG: PAS domain-containing protein, partial [Bacteroidetes bacterium]|nr:PAS domain-containing protein [Fibrella sp.]